MIRYVRPPQPRGFPTQAMEDEKRELASNHGHKAKPLWSNFKEHFFKAQHGKCGFCEAKILGHTGDVEHYAPKLEVHELVSPGRELPHSTRVEHRTVAQPPMKPGYWWLTYQWTNWLLACSRCNSVWKLCLFPVAEQPRSAPNPSDPCTPLLLNPFDDDPEEHLDVDAIGQLVAITVRGRETIQTCGLDRDSLRRERHYAVRDTVFLCRVALRAQGVELEEALEQLRRVADPQRAFAAAVRATIRRLLDLSRAELGELLRP